MDLMKLIALKSLDRAFESGLVRGVTLKELSEKEYYLAIRILDQRSGKSDFYALMTTRGDRRSWADPRKCFGFLKERFGVLHGSFDLDEDNDEPQIPAVDGDESRP